MLGNQGLFSLKLSGNGLAVLESPVPREELIEIETYRFLKKYRYDQRENRNPEVEYQDTTANEISRIIDYVKTSNVLS